MLSPSHTVITATFLSRKNPTFLFRPKKKKKKKKNLLFKGLVGETAQDQCTNDWHG